MSTMVFNAISYSNKLKNSKDKNEMADIQAEELSNIISQEVASKQDLNMVEARLSNEIKNVKNEMIIKLGSIVIGCTFIISILIGVLGFLLKS
jgi:hypothetical protein